MVGKTALKCTTNTSIVNDLKLEIRVKRFEWGKRLWLNRLLNSPQDQQLQGLKLQCFVSFVIFITIITKAMELT